MNNALIAELTNEGVSTRKLLECIPSDKFDYKPHEKSTSLINLAIHIAEMPSMINSVLFKDEVDFGEEDYTPPEIKNTEDLVKLLEDNLKKASDDLLKTNDMALLQNWCGKYKGNVLFTMPRIQVLRTMLFNHLYHHRGQLSVYLRMIDVPLPQIYGPTADNP